MQNKPAKITGKIPRYSQSQKANKNFALNAWLGLGIMFLLIMGLCTLAKRLPIWVLGWYIAINIATFLVYAQDKDAAQTNQWRVQESSLHKLALLGGWTGAAAAHKLLRHKSQKVEFRRMFYITVLGNLGLLAVLWQFKQ